MLPGYAQTIFTPMAPVTSNQLHSVWGTSASNVYAVGEMGVMLHYDGHTWTPVDTPAPYHLHDIWGSSETDIYAVGKQGVILHFDGSTWSETTTAQDVWHDDIRSIMGFSGSDIYLVGGYSSFDMGTWFFIRHYDGSTWTTLFRNPQTILSDIWCQSSKNIFIAGGTYMDHSFLYHLCGRTLAQIDTPTPQPLTAVWGDSPSNIYATGIKASSPQGGIFHYDGTKWSTLLQTPQSFHDIWANSSTDIYFVGTQGTIYHSDGTQLTSLSSGTNKDLLGIWSTSNGDLFVVGTEGTILKSQN